MDGTELRFASLTEQARLLSSGELSALELARLYLETWESTGHALNAIAETTAELALAEARQADEERARGYVRGPLHGIPYGAKDLLATRGIPTRWGSPAHRDQIFDYDAAVIEKLRAGGAVLLGKLAMVELAGGGGYAYPSASLHGPGRNPWNPERWAGGSSSGSGAAVAAGLCSFALGSETWGSIMTPATYCGVSGLRPTLGSVSGYGAMQLGWTLDKIGPLARTAEDCALVFSAISGYDPRDPASVDVPLRTASKHWRLGILPLDFSEAPEAEAAFTAAVQVLRDLGMEVSEVELADQPFAELARTILGAETAAAHEAFISGDELDALVDDAQKAGLRGYLSISAADYIRAQQNRVQASRAVRDLFKQCDALLAPTSMLEAPPLDQKLGAWGSRHRSYSVLGAIAGVPSLSVPVGFGSAGLPLGLSITGDLHDELTVLEIGMAFQRATGWHTRRPPHI